MELGPDDINLKMQLYNDGILIQFICPYCDEEIMKKLTKPVLRILTKKNDQDFRCPFCRNKSNIIITKEFHKYIEDQIKYMKVNKIE